jgi:hypothetical protein
MSQSGGTAKDAPNLLLEEELQAQLEQDVFMLPTVTVNGEVYRGTFNCPSSKPADCGLLWAVCAGFSKDTRPAECPPMKKGEYMDDLDLSVPTPAPLDPGVDVKAPYGGMTSNDEAKESELLRTRNESPAPAPIVEILLEVLSKPLSTTSLLQHGLLSSAAADIPAWSGWKRSGGMTGALFYAGDACSNLEGLKQQALRDGRSTHGTIALIDMRETKTYGCAGTFCNVNETKCTKAVRLWRAQEAHAQAVLIIEDEEKTVPGDSAAIPAVRISPLQGQLLKNVMCTGDARGKCDPGHIYSHKVLVKLAWAPASIRSGSPTTATGAQLLGTFKSAAYSFAGADSSITPGGSLSPISISQATAVLRSYKSLGSAALNSAHSIASQARARLSDSSYVIRVILGLVATVIATVIFLALVLVIPVDSTTVGGLQWIRERAVDILVVSGDASGTCAFEKSLLAIPSTFVCLYMLVPYMYRFVERKSYSKHPAATRR